MKNAALNMGQLLSHINTVFHSMADVQARDARVGTTYGESPNRSLDKPESIVS